MKIVPLNDVKNRFSHYLEQSKREDIIVTTNGRPVAVIHGITDEDLEDYLFETDPRFIARIEALRQQYRREGGKPLEEVRRELGLERKRKKPSRRAGARKGSSYSPKNFGTGKSRLSVIEETTREYN